MFEFALCGFCISTPKLYELKRDHLPQPSHTSGEHLLQESKCPGKTQAGKAFAFSRLSVNAEEPFLCITGSLLGAQGTPHNWIYMSKLQHVGQTEPIACTEL